MKRTTTPKKKRELKKETVRRLNVSDLKQVAGGVLKTLNDSK